MIVTQLVAVLESVSDASVQLIWDGDGSRASRLQLSFLGRVSMRLSSVSRHYYIWAAGEVRDLPHNIE